MTTTNDLIKEINSLNNDIGFGYMTARVKKADIRAFQAIAKAKGTNVSQVLSTFVTWYLRTNGMKPRVGKKIRKTVSKTSSVTPAKRTYTKRAPRWFKGSQNTVANIAA